MPPEDLHCCRVIFGEADGFPGLTVDRFGPVLVVQALEPGHGAASKDQLLPILAQVLRRDGQDIAGIYLRNDVALREKEGLNAEQGLVSSARRSPARSHRGEHRGKRHPLPGGLSSTDRKPDSFWIRNTTARRWRGLSMGRTVLDCFTHTGSFALNAARGGAKHVTAVDVSEFAVPMRRGKRPAQRAGRGHGVPGRQCVRPAAGAGKGA